MVPSALAAIALLSMQARGAAEAVGQVAAGAPAETPAIGGYGSGYGELLVVSLGLVAVVAVLAIAVVRGLGGRGWSRRGGLLEVIARQPLEPRRSLYVVRAGTRTLLVGTSELGVTMLTELEGVLAPGQETGPVPNGQGGFAELVRQAALRWGQGRRGGQRGARSAAGEETARDGQAEGAASPRRAVADDSASLRPAEAGASASSRRTAVDDAGAPRSGRGEESTRADAGGARRA